MDLKLHDSFEFNSAIYSLNEELDSFLSQKYKALHGEARCYLNMGMLWSEEALSEEYFFEAIKYHKKGLKIAKEINDKKLMIKFLDVLAQAFLEIEDYDSSIKCYRKCLKIAHKIDDSESRMKCYNGLFIILDMSFVTCDDSEKRKCYVELFTIYETLSKIEDKFMKGSSHPEKTYEFDFYLELEEDLIKTLEIDEEIEGIDL